MLNAQHQNQPKTRMNNDTKPRLFPNLIDEVLKDPGHCVDNAFAPVWKALNFSRIIQRAGFKKRSGVPVLYEFKYVRVEAKIKIPILRRIFVGSFYCNVEHIVSYVTDVAMKNTDKKTG